MFYRIVATAWRFRIFNQRLTIRQFETDEKYKHADNSKSRGSGFRLKMCCPLGGVSAMVRLIFREYLENDSRLVKSVNVMLIDTVKSVNNDASRL
jgi:hypothetical protein